MADQKPTGIKIENSKNVKLDSNIFVGDMNAIEANNVENLEATNNKQFISQQGILEKQQ